MSALGPVAAVQAGNPLSGVKRPLQSNPVRIPSNRPADRGRPVEAAGPVRAPALKQSNLPNRTTNVTVPYSRVCPFFPDQPRLGRVERGDVLFVDKGFLGDLTRRPAAGYGTRNHCLGLDAVNRRLHGATHPDGWVIGVNCFEAPEDDIPSLFQADRRDDEDVLMSELERYKLDGVVLSNDEREAANVATAQQNVVTVAAE